MELPLKASRQVSSSAIETDACCRNDLCSPVQKETKCLPASLTIVSLMPPVLLNAEIPLSVAVIQPALPRHASGWLCTCHWEQVPWEKKKKTLRHWTILTFNIVEPTGGSATSAPKPCELSDQTFWHVRNLSDLSIGGLRQIIGPHFAL